MRKFIHIDMDCFYAAVEMRDNPALRHIPIAIGGSAKRRGVISTCNYIARRFGVRSAMATAHALKLCPMLQLVPGRMDEYARVSRQIRAIFARYTNKIEPLSLDEAYLDVTGSIHCQGSATLIAERIRQQIAIETGLTASAGVAPLKFVAKIASDENKPNGICVVTPDKLDAFVARLPLAKIPGVGKVSAEKLRQLGLTTCADVRAYPLTELIKRFGKFGPIIWQRAHAIDERELSLSRQRKSVGVERTLSQDITSKAQCQQLIDKLFPMLQARLHQARANTSDYTQIQSQGIKLKFNDFRQTTVEHKHAQLQHAYFATLLEEGLQRQGNRSIRLLGLHVGLPEASQNRQLLLPFMH